MTALGEAFRPPCAFPPQPTEWPDGGILCIPTPPDLPMFQPRLAVVTALPKEHAAARRLLIDETVERVPDDHTLYAFGRIAGHNCEHPSVVACLTKYANNPAAVTTTNLVRSFPTVRNVIFVGIAAGVPRPTKPDAHVRLGDVVISSGRGVVQFDLGARRTREFEVRDSSPPPSAALLQAVNLMESAAIVGQFNWATYVREFMKLAGVARPRREPQKPFRHPKDPQRTSGIPRIFRGKIGASNTLMKSAKHRDEVVRKLGIMAIEMEGSGIADATWEAQVGYLLVRGACDYGDERKNDSWQEYAAHTAACCVGAVLVHLPSTGDDSRQQRGAPSEGSLSSSSARGSDRQEGAAPLQHHRDHSRKPISDSRLTCCRWVDAESVLTAGFGGKVLLSRPREVASQDFSRPDPSTVRCIAPIATSQAFLFGNDEGSVWWVDRKSGMCLEVARCESAVYSIDHCPQHRLFFTAERSGSVVEWEYSGDQRRALRRRIVHRHQGPAFAVNYASGERTCRSVGADGVVNTTRPHSLSPHTEEISRQTLFCYQRRAGTEAAGGADGALWFRHVGNREWSRGDGHTDSIRNVALSPAGLWAVTCGKDRTARLWHLGSRQPWVIAQGTDYFYDVCFSPNSSSVALCDGSGVLHFIDFGRSIDAYTPAAIHQWWSRIE